MRVGGTAGGINQVMALRQEILQRSQALQQVRTGSASEASGTDAAQAGTPTGAPGQVAGFADTLQNAMQDVSAVQKRSSDMQAAYERGEVTDVAKVMLARQEAGVAFEATLQVRNKLLSAYQDILRMGG
ncbi:flagellar hook-basal body complex protein FliE [Erythrobacter sp. SCSIO 43205]|uniref:flagellar hook-basal body complex protein FliE n=1 Tax=Erythrobacter sp. SCSIO 43205 TaxID=2779361 RepID=UPI001CA9C297|nr:flagellar hook-basal body complex protein FliE [Erythrobacter sp. SCSIO 43205]UAB78738.1 flagellar hook-basal body complex protein FliE [Erythrobacter sp. SCSIO 43205]